MLLRTIPARRGSVSVHGQTAAVFTGHCSVQEAKIGL